MEKNETADKARYIPVLFPETLVERIDDYRFRNRLPSRAEAIRALIQAALRGKKSAKPREE